MSDSEVFLYCMLGAAVIVFVFMLLIVDTSGDSTGHNHYYNRSYRSHNNNDWEDNDFDGFHDNDDGPWNEDKY